MEMIKLLKFGSPQVQDTYKELCETAKISFDEFQLNMIEDTGFSYDQLKEFWTDGTSVDVSDEEFAIFMQELEHDAVELLASQNKFTESERKAWIKRMNLEKDLVSAIDNRLVYNEQKKKSFIFKHNLRKEYRNGITIKAQFLKSEKLRPKNQELIDDFDIVMKQALTVSYEQLLKDYIDHPSD
jgi:hypothetical protein